MSFGSFASAASAPSPLALFSQRTAPSNVQALSKSDDNRVESSKIAATATVFVTESDAPKEAVYEHSSQHGSERASSLSDGEAGSEHDSEDGTACNTSTEASQQRVTVTTFGQHDTRGKAGMTQAECGTRTRSWRIVHTLT